MLHFNLSEDQQLIVDTVRKFAQDTLAKKALEWDEGRELAAESVSGMAEMGLFGLTMSEDAGGAGLGMLAYAAAVEELARSCTSSARILVSQAGLCAAALEGIEAGAELLGELAMGEKLGAYVGMDACVMAAPAGDGFTLDGNCPVATLGGKADVILVGTRREDGGQVLLQVPADRVTTEGSGALGFRATAPARLQFAGVSVAAGDVLATGEDAQAAIQRAEAAGWLGGAALAVGAGSAAVQLAKSHAGERIAFGKPLLRQQAVADKVVDATRKLDGARHQMVHAARMMDAGEDAHGVTMQAWLSATEAGIHAADEAIQIHGGYGYTTEYHVERHYRDICALRTMDRGSEHLRRVLAAAIA